MIAQPSRNRKENLARQSLTHLLVLLHIHIHCLKFFWVLCPGASHQPEFIHQPIRWPQLCLPYLRYQRTATRCLSYTALYCPITLRTPLPHICVIVFLQVIGKKSMVTFYCEHKWCLWPKIYISQKNKAPQSIIVITTQMKER